MTWKRSDEGNSWKCPACGSGQTHVTDARMNSSGYFRRRRHCKDCDTKFTTFEMGRREFDLVKQRQKEIAELRWLLQSLGAPGDPEL